MKKIWVVGASTLCIMALALLYFIMRDSSSEKPTATPIIQKAVVNAEFVRRYSSIEELARDAGLIAEGRVVDVTYVEHANGETYTKVAFEVDKAYKGNVESGERVTILEIGGITTAGVVNRTNQVDTEIDPSLANAKIAVTLEGAPLAEVGERVVYFGVRGELGLVPGTYYVPLGAFQGKFYVRDDVAERFVPDDMLSDSLGRLRTGREQFEADLAAVVADE